MRPQPPLFCDHCSYLALAMLSREPLCLSCLLTAIKNSVDPYLVYKIRPLRLDPPEIKGLVKREPQPDFALAANISKSHILH